MEWLCDNIIGIIAIVVAIIVGFFGEMRLRVITKNSVIQKATTIINNNGAGIYALIRIENDASKEDIEKAVEKAVNEITEQLTEMKDQLTWKEF